MESTLTMQHCLIGCTIAYPAAILMVVPPTNSICIVSSLGMHIGFCLTYSTIAVVSYHIYIPITFISHTIRYILGTHIEILGIGLYVRCTKALG